MENLSLQKDAANLNEKKNKRRDNIMKNFMRRVCASDSMVKILKCIRTAMELIIKTHSI
jgi:hypothetical protein